MPALIDFVKELISTSYCLCCVYCTIYFLRIWWWQKKKGCFPVSRIYILVFHTLHRDTLWCDSIVTCVKEKYNIRCKYSRAPFRSIIQHYIVSMIFCLCCYCCHSETSLSFSLVLSFSALFLSLNFSIKLSLFIYNRLSLSLSLFKCFHFIVFFLSRAIYFLCTYTGAIALFSLYCPGLVRIYRWRMPLLRYPTPLIICQFVFTRC